MTYLSLMLGNIPYVLEKNVNPVYIFSAISLSSLTHKTSPILNCPFVVYVFPASTLSSSDNGRPNFLLHNCIHLLCFQ